jgi:hypothetical protein
MLTVIRVGLYFVMATGFLFVLNLVFLVPGKFDGTRLLLMSIGAGVVGVALFWHSRLTDLEIRRKKNL